MIYLFHITPPPSGFARYSLIISFTKLMIINKNKLNVENKNSFKIRSFEISINFYSEKYKTLRLLFKDYFKIAIKGYISSLNVKFNLLQGMQLMHKTHIFVYGVVIKVIDQKKIKFLSPFNNFYNINNFNNFNNKRGNNLFISIVGTKTRSK